MDSIRYGIAVALICGIPPLLLFWPVLHGLLSFWRGRPFLITYGLITGLLLGVAALIFSWRQLLLGADYGMRWPLLLLGLLFLIAAGWMRRKLAQVISSAQLAGLQELQGGSLPQQLIRSGLYSHVRHPRYVQLCMAFLGYGLIANYQGAYLACLLWLAGIFLVTFMEERELRQRFGAEYEAYARKVPRFIPRIGRRG